MSKYVAMYTSKLENNYGLMQRKLASMKTWRGAVPFNVNNSNDFAEEIDLCVMLKRNESYYFLDRFSGVGSKKNSLTKIGLSSMKAGFSLVHCVS